MVDEVDVKFVVNILRAGKSGCLGERAPGKASAGQQPVLSMLIRLW